MISHVETKITIGGGQVPVVVTFQLSDGGRIDLLERKIRREHVSSADNRKILSLCRSKVEEMRSGGDLFTETHLADIERCESQRLSAETS